MRFQRTLTLLMLAMGLLFALPARAQQKPFTRDQVQGLVRDGLGDESGVKLIEQRGIDFAPLEDFLQSLKAAGASEAFLKALRAAKQPEPASMKKPLNQVQVFALLAGQVTSPRVAMLVRERGIDFEPQQDYLDEVRLGGGDDDLIAALKSAKVTKPVSVDPAAQARQAEVREHVARGAELAKKGQYAEAELEYRAAIQLEPENADLWAGLSDALGSQLKWEEAIKAAREAVRLDPRNETAHVYLGIALRENAPCGISRLIEDSWKAAIAGRTEQINVSAYDCREADLNGSILEFREAIRLNPDDEWAHYQLGYALDLTGNLDAGIGEYDEALRKNPNYAQAHFALGNDLGQKGDLDGAIIETRAAVRLGVKNSIFHAGLARWLEKRGDQEEALSEYREAYTLDPQSHKLEYEAFLKKVNDAHKLDKLQHWLGTWIFAGPVKVSLGCGGRRFPMSDVDIPNYKFKILTITPNGEVTAQVEHPLGAEDISKGTSGPDWSGTATETTLVLTMNRVPPGTVLFGTGDKLKSAVGRLEARREGDRYSVDFFYSDTEIVPNGRRCSDFFQDKRFLGQMTHP
jgi:tetratricopeptide (TPR) repeat protein